MLNRGRQVRVRNLLNAALYLCVLLFPPLQAWAQHDSDETRVTMQRIFQNLRVVLPLSAERERFADPARRQEILQALRAMADAADSLDSHTQGFDPGRRYIGRSLALDVRRTLRYFDWKDYGRAEFFVQQTADACVSCHSRIESATDSPLAAGFFREEEIAELDLSARAKLQIATRRFDDALATFEQIFESPASVPAELLEPWTQYLAVCIRVKRDLKRPIPALTAFAKRKDLWKQLRGDVETWTETLKSLSQSEVRVDVASAHDLIEQGRSVAEYPGDRRALVHYLMASRSLNDLVAERSEPGPEQAQAYYLLGITETRIEADFWRSPADFYLEQAVRLHPHSEVAGRAYAFLEEETVLGYTGSGGTHLPRDIRARLEELRRLAEALPANSNGPKK